MSKKVEFLNLGLQPLANYYLTKGNLIKKEKKYRLIICYDKKDKLISIKKPFQAK